MQTIVNLVSAGLGVAWVPESVRQFQRPGVVYRALSLTRGRARVVPTVPRCETSLVWRDEPSARGGAQRLEAAPSNPSLARFVEFLGFARAPEEKAAPNV